MIKEQCVKLDSESPVTAGDYYVSMCSREDHVLTTLEKYLPRFGRGLCAKLFKTALSGLTNGVANIKLDVYDGNHRYHFNRHWLSQCLTFPERDVLVVLDRISKDARLVCRPYDDDDESACFVYRSAVAKSLRYPMNADVMHHPELTKYTPSQIRTAVEMLHEHLTPDGLPEFSFADEDVEVAKYVPHDHAGAVPSKVTDAYSKIKRSEVMPLVVRRSIFEVGQQKTYTDTDDLLHRYLTVAGAYPVGTRVFAGVDSDTGVDIPYHYITMRDEEVSIVVQNPLFRSKAADRLMLGHEDEDDDAGVAEGLLEDEDDDADMNGEHLFFDPDLRDVVFDNTSKLEERLSEFMFKRLCLPEEYREVFLSSYSTH